MDPYHGDILAIASYPPFDPNQPPGRGEDPTARFNHAVSVPFEPGSVFKVITLSAALETTDLKPASMINCGNGSFTMAGRTVHEAHHGYGIMPMEMVLAKSSNIGAIQIGLRVGAAKLYEYVRRFGLGARTGIPLPAESPGHRAQAGEMAHHLADVGFHGARSGRDHAATRAGLFGGGQRRVAGAAAPDSEAGRRRPCRWLLPHRILKPETAITMRKMMEGVVLFGTGHRYANSEGYSSAGKTGSAQIFDYATGHYTHIYNASFMGFAPVTNPAIVVVVTVNGTHGGSAGYGGPVAGPVFREVMHGSVAGAGCAQGSAGHGSRTRGKPRRPEPDEAADPGRAGGPARIGGGGGASAGATPVRSAVYGPAAAARAAGGSGATAQRPQGAEFHRPVDAIGGNAGASARIARC